MKYARIFIRSSPRNGSGGLCCMSTKKTQLYPSACRQRANSKQWSCSSESLHALAAQVKIARAEIEHTLMPNLCCHAKQQKYLYFISCAMPALTTPMDEPRLILTHSTCTTAFLPPVLSCKLITLTSSSWRKLISRMSLFTVFLNSRASSDAS